MTRVCQGPYINNFNLSEGCDVRNEAVDSGPHVNMPSRTSFMDQGGDEKVLVEIVPTRITSVVRKILENRE